MFYVYLELNYEVNINDINIFKSSKHAVFTTTN